VIFVDPCPIFCVSHARPHDVQVGVVVAGGQRFRLQRVGNALAAVNDGVRRKFSAFLCCAASISLSLSITICAEAMAGENSPISRISRNAGEKVGG